MLQPGAEGTDALVAQMNGGMNFGSNTALASGQGPDFGGSEKRSFLQFNLSSIPAGATINSATLSLYVSQAAGGAQTASAYKVTATWDEAAVNWSNQPSSDATAVSSVAVNSVGWKSWTITSLVGSWCNGSVTNNGILVKQSSGSPPNNVQFYSSDYGGDATLRPKLVVDYSSVNNPPTAVSLNAPTNDTDTTVDLSWSQNADADFQSYKLYRSTSAGVTEQSTLVTTVTQQTSTTFTDTGLMATTAYYYRIFVVDTGALSSGSNEVSATTAATPPPPPSVANLSVSATPTSIVADGAAQSTITATLTDVNNQPVADHAVDFTTTAGTLSAASATSNAQGNAVVTLTSGTTAGTANIVSTSSGLTGTCSVTFTAPPPPPAPTLTVTANPSTLTANGTSPSTITATLIDGSDQPMAGQTINFQTTAGTLSPTSATTNAQGIATVTLTSGTQAANVTITATSSNATGTCSVTFTTSSPPPSTGSTLTVTASPSTLLADGVSQSTITATLIDGNNQPMAGQAINFQTTAGTLSPTIATTNAQGIVTVTLTSGTQAATPTITAISTSVTGTCSVTFNGGSSSGTPTLLMTVDPSELPADGQSAASVTALYRDATGSPVAGATIHFGANLGTTMGPAETVTNEQGIASATLTAGTIVGTAQVGATAPDVTASATIDLQEPLVKVTFVYPSSSSAGGSGASSQVSLGAQAQSVTANPIVPPEVTGDFIPVAVHVEVTSGSSSGCTITGQAFYVDEEPTGLAYSVMPLPILTEGNKAHYALVYLWGGHGCASGPHTLHVKLKVLSFSGSNGPQNGGFSVLHKQVAVTLNNDPIIESGPEPTVVKWGVLGTYEETLNPVFGNVRLKAVVRGRTGIIPAVSICNQPILSETTDNRSTVDKVRFEVAGTTIGEVNSDQGELDLDTDPAGHVRKFYLPWDSAKQTGIGDPFWPDDTYDVAVKAFCGASVGTASSDLSLKNMGGLEGTVKDEVTSEPIAGATLVAKREHIYYVGPPEPIDPGTAGTLADWVAYWIDHVAWEIQYNNPVNWEGRVFASSSSAADGSYHLDLYPGEYQVSVSQHGYVWERLSGTVSPNQVGELNALMQPRLTTSASPDHIAIPAYESRQSKIRVHLVDQWGDPQPNARVDLTVSSGPGALGDLYLLTDDNGDGTVDLNDDNSVTDGDDGASPRFTTLGMIGPTTEDTLANYPATSVVEASIASDTSVTPPGPGFGRSTSVRWYTDVAALTGVTITFESTWGEPDAGEWELIGEKIQEDGMVVQFGSVAVPAAINTIYIQPALNLIAAPVMEYGLETAFSLTRKFMEIAGEWGTHVRNSLGAAKKASGALDDVEVTFHVTASSGQIIGVATREDAVIFGEKFVADGETAVANIHRLTTSSAEGIDELALMTAKASDLASNAAIELLPHADISVNTAAAAELKRAEAIAQNNLLIVKKANAEDFLLQMRNKLQQIQGGAVDFQTGLNDVKTLANNLDIELGGAGGNAKQVAKSAFEVMEQASGTLFTISGPGTGPFIAGLKGDLAAMINDASPKVSSLRGNANGFWSEIKIVANLDPDTPVAYGLFKEPGGGTLEAFANSFDPPLTYLQKKGEWIIPESVDQVEFSKAVLNDARARRRRIAFKLTGMGDNATIQGLLNNEGYYRDAITSQELRHIHENWDGSPGFNGIVDFYRDGALMDTLPWNLVIP